MTAALPLVLVANDATPTWREPRNGKGSAALLRLSERHYTRQTPDSDQCCRPGFNYVLVLSDGSAAWVVWRPDPTVGRMDNLECWECTFFRNEGARLSSDLIREATALTYRKWGWPPPDGFVTAVGVEQTKRRRSKRSPPGRCFIEAGWEPINKPGDGKVWLRAPRPVRSPRTIPSLPSPAPKENER